MKTKSFDRRGLQLSVARESTSLSVIDLTSKERSGLEDVLGMLLDAGDMLEAESVMQMFGVHSRTIDILTV